MNRTSDKRLIFAILLLLIARFVAGAMLPLSADEAYYWLWSKHLAWGYYDHPPMIAATIWLGTAVFGDTEFGVRVVTLLLSFASTWAVWRCGEILLASRRGGLLAALLFNLTIMVGVETLAATPDALATTGAALFLLALAKVEQTGNSKYWLAAGLAAGFTLMSKYTGFFLGIGAIAWLLFDGRVRRWLWTPWPWMGMALALLLFLPNLLWNASHGWLTFAFQFGRVGEGHFTLRFLGEFLLAQIGLATPLIFLLAAFGLFARSTPARRISALVPAMVWPSVAYFLFHSLHDRVQANWPSFLYPALAIAAAAAMLMVWDGWRAPVMAFSRRWAAPLAAVLLAVCYVQSLFVVVPLGRADPLERLPATGFSETAMVIGRFARSSGYAAIVTTNYEMVSWLRFYSHLPVIDLGENYRWLAALPPSEALWNGPLLYVSSEKKDARQRIAAIFDRVASCGHFERSVHGHEIGVYRVYCLSGPKNPPLGRMP